MKKEEENKTETLDLTNEELSIKQHENGEWYKELEMEGLDEPIKLFNTLKDQRLEGETHTEYKVRKLFSNMDKKQGHKEMFYNPYKKTYLGMDGKTKGTPYVNENKKDKFKKKK